MSRIRDAIRDITADGKVTADEWKTKLQPELTALPKRASDDTHALAELFASDKFTLEDGARSGLRGALLGFGYDAPAQRPANETSAQFLDDLVRSNVGEHDAEFDRLSAATGKDKDEVTIAILNGGFDVSHDDLDGKLWTNPGEIAGDGIDNDGNGLVDDIHGWDFAEHDADVKGLTHGTHVTGIATGGTDRINAITNRVFDNDLDGNEIAQAIDYAAAHGARVMNMSFRVNDATELKPILDAMKRHPEVLFVKSAGNDGSNGPGKPKPGDPGDLSKYDANAYLARQQLPNLAVVSAADPDGKLAEYSNWGAPYSTHAARGTDVFSSVDGDQYEHMSGTSMASPTFENAVAKMLMLDDKLTPEQLKGMLTDTTDVSDNWKDLTASGGVINAGKAMRLAALTGLIRGGQDAGKAADQIGLGAGPERDQLLKLAARYVPAPPPAQLKAA
ncbi:MAG TPA: S8 family serine peptidase [Myxococcales bacterium]|nr:S8 family serine peptidase [Myxococcales bacterium]